MSGLKRALSQPNFERISLAPPLSPLAEAKFAQSRLNSLISGPKGPSLSQNFGFKKGPLPKRILVKMGRTYG
jgi:hypothetical protein